MEFISSLRSGIVEVVCVRMVFHTDISLIEEDSEEGKSQASGFQTFGIDSYVGGRFPWGLQMGTL